MPYPSNPIEIETRVGQLATQHSAIATRLQCAHRTHEGGTVANPGRVVTFLRIGTGIGEGRPRILIVAGIHARELAPPDAVLAFVEKLLVAYANTGPIRYLLWDDPRVTPPRRYKEFTVGWPVVQRIVERTELYVLPLANPDGRAFALPPSPVVGWRKNRRPPPPNTTCPPLPPAPPEDLIWMSNDPAGVDINRNFDIAWDFTRYYDATVAATPAVASMGNICALSQTFHGPTLHSEPETLNVEELLNSRDINFYMDVHSAAQKFLYAWGMEQNQSDASRTDETFKNPVKDHHRDGPGSGYAEWMPPGMQAAHQTLGGSMATAILNSTGYGASDATPGSVAEAARNASRHETVQSIDLFGTNSNFSGGISRDYAFSRQIDATPGPIVRASARAPIYSYTFECGSAADGGFIPHPTNEYPKVEREVGAAIATFLAYASGWHNQVVTTPSPPSSGGPCLIATAAYGTPTHPRVQALRALRDDELRATVLGRVVLARVEPIYYALSPAVARRLDRHDRVRRIVRIAGVAPALALVRVAAAPASRLRSRERRVRWTLALLGAVALALLATAALLARELVRVIA